MKTRSGFGAKKSVKGLFAGRNGAADTCIGSTGACIRMLQDRNAGLWACIAALWDYIGSPLADNAPLWVCNAPLRPFTVPARDYSNALQGNDEPSRAFRAALQSRIATMLPFFWALQANGGSMQASAESMQDREARDGSPFFPNQNNPNLEVTKNGIRQSSR